MSAFAQLPFAIVRPAQYADGLALFFSPSAVSRSPTSSACLSRPESSSSEGSQKEGHQHGHAIPPLPGRGGSEVIRDSRHMTILFFFLFVPSFILYLTFLINSRRLRACHVENALQRLNGHFARCIL